MKRPRWLELSGDEIAELRETPSVQMIMEWLEWERERAREIVLGNAALGQPTQIMAGKALAFDHLLASLHTPKPIADMPDDDFRDPAQRPSRRKDSDAEV